LLFGGEKVEKQWNYKESERKYVGNTGEKIGVVNKVKPGNPIGENRVSL